jgi:hypothetical protein
VACVNKKMMLVEKMSRWRPLGVAQSPKESTSETKRVYGFEHFVTRKKK